MPAITHGPRAGGQHTVSEWVEIDDLVRVAKLYAAIAVDYCNAITPCYIRPTPPRTHIADRRDQPPAPDLIDEAQTTEEAFLRQIFVRDQMAEWSKQPLVMARADGVFTGMSTASAISTRSRASMSFRSDTTIGG